jgi:hypothetical protein
MEKRTVNSLERSTKKGTREMKTTTNTENEPAITWVLETKFKDLTDEEIRQIAVECGVYINEQGSIYPDDMCIYSFARAILLKAQEK